MYSENFRKSSKNYSVKVIFNYGKNQVTWRKNPPKDCCFFYSAVLITHNFTFLAFMTDFWTEHFKRLRWVMRVDFGQLLEQRFIVNRGKTVTQSHFETFIVPF